MLLADGFEKAYLGVGMRCGQPDIAVYDWHICVQVLIDRDGMSEEEAEEWMSFNVVGAWAGEMTPIFVVTGDICGLDLEASG